MSDSLSSLIDERSTLLRQVFELGDFQPGSISSPTRRCGKPSCHCAKPDEPGHGLIIAAVGLILLRRVSPFVKFAILTGSLTLLRCYFNYDLVPQADRYHLEMDMGLIFGGVPLLARSLPGRAKVWFACLLLLFCGEQIWRSWYFARGIIKNIDVTQRVEFRSAEWLALNMPGERVMAPGSIQFWLNAFSDSPQLGGGFENGNISWENRVARYYISTGSDARNVVT